MGILQALFKPKRNETNSSMGVYCIATGKCEFRHTESCKRCTNNCKPKEKTNYFKARG